MSPDSANTKDDKFVYGYTGGQETFTVPAGVAFLDLTLDGGHGGSGTHNYPEAVAGGAGGEVTGTLTSSQGSPVTYTATVHQPRVRRSRPGR